MHTVVLGNGIVALSTAFRLVQRWTAQSTDTLTVVGRFARPGLFYWPLIQPVASRPLRHRLFARQFLLRLIDHFKQHRDQGEDQRHQVIPAFAGLGGDKMDTKPQRE